VEFVELKYLKSTSRRHTVSFYRPGCQVPIEFSEAVSTMGLEKKDQDLQEVFVSFNFPVEHNFLTSNGILKHNETEATNSVVFCARFDLWLDGGLFPGDGVEEVDVTFQETEITINLIMTGEFEVIMDVNNDHTRRLRRSGEKL